MRQPKDQCKISKRTAIPKGWGSGIKGGRFKRPHKEDSEVDRKNIGEIFVYHKIGWPHNPHHNDPQFEVGTVKLLFIEKDKRLSTHFHINKQEIFFLIQGQLELGLIADGYKEVIEFNEGDCLHIPPGMVHYMKGLGERNILLEVSTTDHPSDSYRIEKGD